MTLEDVIYQQLTGSKTLAALLAAYSGAPAVFYQTAPDDKAAGWEQRKQYPRLSYIVDYIANPERKTSGILTLDILCTEEGAAPEEIEPIVRGLLGGIFMTPDDAAPCSLAWARSDSFEQARADGNIIGTTVTFDLYAFPAQITTDPDPVLAMNRWTEDLIDTATIIGGRKPTDRIFVPTPLTPAFYWRVEALTLARETNTVAWVDGVVIGHIFAGGEETGWLRYTTNTLMLAGEVLMLDTSPMLLKKIKADNTLSALAQGQLRLDVQFGLLRRPGYAHPLMHPIMTHMTLTQ